MKRILIIANKYWQHDPRLQREVKALSESKFAIDLILPVPKLNGNPRLNGLIGSIKIHPIRLSRKRGSKLRYIWEYMYFFVSSFLKTLILSLTKRYHLVQVFAMPEFNILICLPLKIMGTPILLDWMDPSDEVYRSIYNKRKSIFFLSLIRFFESIATSMADHIITPNEGFRHAFSKRGVNLEKISIVMNSADDQIFECIPEESRLFSKHEEFLVLFHGTIVWRNGLDIAIHAFAELVKSFPNARLIVAGSGEQNFEEYCYNFIKQLKLDDKVQWCGFVNLDDLPKLLSLATVGVISNRKTPFTNINLPTRILEYAAMQIPMVLPILGGILDYFDDSTALFFEPGDAQDLARCLNEMARNPHRRRELADTAYGKYQNISWARQKHQYLSVVQKMIATRGIKYRYKTQK